METILIVITLVLASLAFIGVIVAIILIVKSHRPVGPDKEQIQATEQIKAAIESLKETIPLQVSKSVADQMVAINKTVSDQMISVTKTLKDETEADNKRLLDFQNVINTNLNTSIKTLNEKVDTNLQAINAKVDKSLSEGFKGTSESMEKLQNALGAIGKAQDNIQSLSGEVVSLKGILTNNQQRGKYGEMQLEMILQAMFGETKGSLYDTQYILQKAGDGVDELKPDAVIFLDGDTHKQILCIDSKFSLTGYETLFDSAKELSDSEKADLKTKFKGALRLRVLETAKYVIPGKTVKPAIMFVPNDGVFAFIQNEFPDLVDDARSRNVIIASPTILQPLIASFRVMQIDAAKSRNIEKINDSLNALKVEFGRFDARWSALQRQIGLVGRTSEDMDKTVHKLTTKFGKIADSDFSAPAEVEGDEEPEQITSSANPDEGK
jgi:DNA recombination protein RmuC